jgi:succinoglycan biosynthesis protein ExoL
MVLFVPDITDVSTIKRVEAFAENGVAPTVFGFRRARYNRDFQPPWPYVELGRTADRRYFHRALALFAALRHLVGNRRIFAGATLFYARNIDQLLLALLARWWFRPRAEVIYEVLDLPPLLTKRGLAAAAFRWLERRCLKKIKLLVVSSPGFVRNHYLAVQHYQKEWFVLENKLQASVLGSMPRPAPGVTRCEAKAQGYRWVVGYFGLIRGQRTFDLMTRLAERLSDEVLFKFSGIITTVDPNSFLAALERNRNMIFEGDYISPRDLPRLYRSVDFAWALDLEHAEHNSRWLLPCRFYEAGLFGVPCLAVHDFEVGRLVDELEIGWTFDEPLEESLVSFFRSLDPVSYARIRDRLMRLPESTFVSGDDVATLCQLMCGKKELVPPPAGSRYVSA